VTLRTGVMAAENYSFAITKVNDISEIYSNVFDQIYGEAALVSI